MKKDKMPIDAIREKMKEKEISLGDFGKIIGSYSRASEIMNQRRKLNLKQIRKINEHLDIPLEILVKDYNLIE